MKRDSLIEYGYILTVVRMLNSKDEIRKAGNSGGSGRKKRESGIKKGGKEVKLTVLMAEEKEA